jgi:hypothetical protein
MHIIYKSSSMNVSGLFSSNCMCKCGAVGRVSECRSEGSGFETRGVFAAAAEFDLA